MRRSLILTLAVALSICLINLAEAQAMQIDAFTFFIPYPADALDNQFDAAHETDFVGSNIVTTISISVLRDGSVIYYDHWEDGLEVDITLPNQPTTQVWGDDNPANGTPPGLGSDILDAGDVIALQNIVQVEPRDPGVVRYDGGDKLVSLGGAIAVSVAVWPETVVGEEGVPIAGILFAGAWELYPVSRWGTNYVIPVGENVPRGAGSFSTVGLNVQAVQDGTSVEVDLDADGVFEIIEWLDEGEQLTQVQGVNAGARVRASAPVQVHLFTGNPVSYYEARAYTMLPRDQWAGEYLAPRSSDGDFWLYNPHDTELTVSAAAITGTDVIVIPPASVAKFPPVGLSSATGVHFTAANDFYVIAALDESEEQDWGYALLPIENLTSQVLVGWAPGNNRRPPDNDESRVYLTALSETTALVDYDNDGNPDASFPVAPLDEVAITDPNDHDMTGARIYVENGVPFEAVWGQDEGAPPALPSIDVGTNIVPLRAPSIQQQVDVVDGYVCGSWEQPYILDFELHVYNDSFVDFPEVIVANDLPPEFTYVRGSTIAGGVPIPDDSSGTPFPLDEGGHNVGRVPGFGDTLVYFRAVTESTGLFVNRAQILSPRSDPSIKLFQLPAVWEAGYEMSKTLIDPPSNLIFPEPGQVITFNLTVTNTLGVTITRLPMFDSFDENLLTFQNASLSPDLTAPGVITWTDLTIPLGDLPPGESIAQTVSFSLTYPIPLDVFSTSNYVLGEGRDNLDRTRVITCGRAAINFPTPTPPVTITPTPPDTPGDGTETPTPPRDDTPTPPPGTPTPGTGTPTTPTTGTPTLTTGTPGLPPGTPTLPVLFLPETGTDPVRAAPRWWLWLAWPILGLLAAGLIRLRRE